MMPTDDYIGWARYNDHNGRRATTMHLCSSDAPGAFKIYRAARSEPICTTSTEFQKDGAKPEELAEKYIADMVSSAPEPLRELGDYLSRVLDEDEFKTAERYVLAAMTASLMSESEAEIDAGLRGFGIDPAEAAAQWQRAVQGALAAHRAAAQDEPATVCDECNGDGLIRGACRSGQDDERCSACNGKGAFGPDGRPYTHPAPSAPTGARMLTDDEHKATAQYWQRLTGNPRTVQEALIRKTFEVNGIPLAAPEAGKGAK